MVRTCVAVLLLAACGRPAGLVEGTVGGKTIAIQDVVFDFPQKSAKR